MGYLILKDYDRRIQSKELGQITSLDDTIRVLSESSVMAEIKEVLIQRFDMLAELTDTDVYSPTVIYKGNNRVYLDAAPYNPVVQYLATSKALVLQNGQVYIIALNTPNPAGAFDATKWTLLGNRYDMFFVTLPYPLFNQDARYLKQDKVFWKNNIYTALKDTTFADQQDRLQAPSIESIVFGNVVPDDRINGAQFWGAGTPYALTAGLLPTDTTKWTKGDNRNQGMVKMFLDMVIYDLCARIAANNVPEARHNLWLAAKKRLKDYANGDLNAQLPIIQPKTGSRIQFGGEPKETFGY